MENRLARLGIFSAFAQALNRTSPARDDALVLLDTQPTTFREGASVAGKYKIVRWLGEGGMGSVYLAVHEATGKRVALKHVRDSSTPEARARFIREARAAARIHHPNVVDVYDVIEDKSGLFLVMEHLEGETLQGRMRRDPKLSTEQSVAITLDIARALSAAHRERVVHRDLKPANIFLADEDGEQRIKVLDFGLAKILDETSSFSQSDHLVGTPHYMAPELVLGAVEARVEMDVYALGVILYELLAGAPPHDHERMTALLVEVATKPAPALHTRANVDPSLSDVVMRALAKNPADRYPSAAQFAEALRACTSPADAPKPTAAAEKPPSESVEGVEPTKAKRPLATRSLVVGLVALTVLVGWWVQAIASTEAAADAASTTATAASTTATAATTTATAASTTATAASTTATAATTTATAATTTAAAATTVGTGPGAVTEHATVVPPSADVPALLGVVSSGEEPRARLRVATAPGMGTPTDAPPGSPEEAVQPTLPPAPSGLALEASPASTSTPRAGTLSLEEF